MKPGFRPGTAALLALPGMAHAGITPPPFDFPGALLLLGAISVGTMLVAARLISLLRRAPGVGHGP